MYYDCLATKIANLPFENSSTRCIPIQYHGLFESIGSNLSRCSTYNENLQIMNEISMQYLLPSMSNTYSFAYWIIQTSLVPYSTKNYSFILGYEIWSNSLISECQKWCSGTQYLGKKDETDSIEPSYKEGLHMSAFYLVTKSTTTKVHHEYLIYDFIGMYLY